MWAALDGIRETICEKDCILLLCTRTMAHTLVILADKQPAPVPSKQRTLYRGGTTLTGFVTMHLCSWLLTLRSAGGSTLCHAQGADMGCKTNRKKQAATTSI